MARRYGARQSSARRGGITATLLATGPRERKLELFSQAILPSARRFGWSGRQTLELYTVIGGHPLAWVSLDLFPASGSAARCPCSAMERR